MDKEETTEESSVVRQEGAKPILNDTGLAALTLLVAESDPNKSVISRHLNTIFKSEELKCKAVVAKNATTAADGKTYQVDYFNLDVIISVGYRVNSIRGAGPWLPTG